MLAKEPGWITRLDDMHLLTPLRVVLVVLVAVVLTVVVRRTVRRVLRRALAVSTDRARAEARQRALASTLGSALVGIVWALAVITIVSEAGVNIGAFVATATVIGGAVAFGAQTLVRDALAGVFVLVEDQYGVGDRIDVGLATGRVDRITLRAVRLRDADGVEWHVPHGAIARVANLSKTSQARVDVEVARGCDPAEVMAVLQRLGEEEPVAGASGPPSMVGLVDVRDDRLVFRLRVPSAPGHTEAVRAAWRLRVLDAFRRGDLTAP